MYRPQLAIKANGLPVVSNDELDVIGERLIADFCPIATLVPQEIDIDRFVVNYLKMEQDFQFLSHCGVYLGMTVFQNTNYLPVYDPVLKEAKYIHANAGTVLIDNTLLESNQEHRYRFTLGHEAGHFVLHPSYFLNQIGIDSSDPFIRCRYDFSLGGSNRYCMTDAKRAEQQANRFSSAILMPRCSVKILLARTPNRGQRNWSSLAVEKLVNTFNVSADAALYRLKELGYIDGNC